MKRYSLNQMRNAQ